MSRTRFKEYEKTLVRNRWAAIGRAFPEPGHLLFIKEGKTALFIALVFYPTMSLFHEQHIGHPGHWQLYGNGAVAAPSKL